jgi:hypothetical protein
MNFVTNTLLDTYKLLGDEIMDLQLVPFGNAKIDYDNKNVTCQHGVGECDANSYEQCSIYLYREPSEHLPFIACLDEELPMGYKPEPFSTEPFEKCAKKTNLSFDHIHACHELPFMAWTLTVKFAKDTPDYHEYVPWVEIEGNKINPDNDSLTAEICKAFKAKGGQAEVCDNVL